MRAKHSAKRAKKSARIKPTQRGTASAKPLPKRGAKSKAKQALKSKAKRAVKSKANPSTAKRSHNSVPRRAKASDRKAGLDNAVALICAQANEPAKDLAKRSKLLDRALVQMDEASQAELDAAVVRLIPALDAADPYSGGIAAMAIGALIESGATPALASDALRRAVTKRMRQAAAFAALWANDDPPETTEEFIEPREATVRGELGVEAERLQRWAAADPIGARAWSRMDDWFLPIMALARFSDECRREIRADEELRAAQAKLDEADPAMFVFLGDVANSTTGTHVEHLLTADAMPRFAGEVE